MRSFYSAKNISKIFSVLRNILRFSSWSSNGGMKTVSLPPEFPVTTEYPYPGRIWGIRTCHNICGCDVARSPSCGSAAYETKADGFCFRRTSQACRGGRREVRAPEGTGKRVGSIPQYAVEASTGTYRSQSDRRA